jgi:hypothetical protein
LIRDGYCNLSASAGRADLPPPRRALFDLGRRYALLFYGFGLFAIKEAIQRRAERVYYFTREGIFFRAIHDRIRAASPLGLNIPSADILEVSRVSTFLPSVREFTTTEFMRVWNL